MYEVRRDAAKNRVYVRLAGQIGLDEASEAAAEVTEALAASRPGFTLLSDISEFRPVTEDARLVIANAKQEIEAAGVGAVARVTGESALGSMQMQRAGDVEYDAYQAESIAEAERLLDEV